MCGICGIINKDGKSVEKQTIKKINDLIIHRGPDDEGYYFGRNFAFGHRRLAILDLSDAGHQPMEYKGKNGEYVIVYNGEIYNYIEIKEELLKQGYKFKSDTDTEVILASYDRWGSECVKRFNGMWAFAIYDKSKNIIFCSRDRFGIKPFYYTEIDNKFIFGSEIKQLLEYHPKRFVNKKILMDYLIIGFEEHTNETFFENIFKLEKSYNLIYSLDNHSYKFIKYYDAKFDKSVAVLNEQESIKLYKNRLKKAIKLRLRSDVKVGTCLSGGLDSSSIAAFASKEYQEKSNKKFSAIHAKSIEDRTDESVYAKKVADSCNIDLTIVEPTAKDFLNYIDEVIYAQEEPFGSPSIFMQYFVFKKAKEIGCKVMLDGQGGDETLLGYERYYPAYLKTLAFKDKIECFFDILKNSKLTIKELIGYIVYFTKANIRIKKLRLRYNYVKEKYFNLISKDILYENSKSYLNIKKLQYNEIFKTQLPHLLRYEDKNSMRNSVEARLPFVDYNIVETSFSLNDKFKIKNGWTKYILRKSVKDILPKDIVWRRNKVGFEAPVNIWLLKLEQYMESVILNSKILKEIVIDFEKVKLKKMDNIQKWKLFNIAKWEEIYNVDIKV